MFGTAITNSAHTQSSRPSFFQKEQGGNTFIQPKLNIGKPGDVYEVEADRVADTIVAKGNEQNTPFFSPSPTIQKQPEEEIQKQGETESEIQEKPLTESITPLIQKQPEEEQIQEKLEEEAQQQEDVVNEIQEKPIIESVTPLLQKQSEEKPIQEKEEQEEIQQKPEEEIQKQPENEILSQDIPAEIPVQQKVDSTATTAEIQKQEEEVQEKEEEEEAIQEKSFLQKSEESDTDIEEEIPVQTKPNDSVTSSGIEKPSIESQLNNTSGGSPMPKDTQSQMEYGFGTDFSGVRVHTDSTAVQLNKDLGAQAFTHGNDIYFNEGKFDTSSNSGKHLLAHELTHTVQQGASVQRKPEISNTSNTVQLLPGFIANKLNEYARFIPGYSLFTVLIEYNPILGETVERTPTNVVEGLLELIPVWGVLLVNKLREYDVFQTAFDWINAELTRLNITSTRIEELINEAWDNMDFLRLDPFDYNIGVLVRTFEGLYNDVVSFADSLKDQVLGFIKDAVVRPLVGFLETNSPTYVLATKVIGSKFPLEEEVNAPTVEILEDFLVLIGKETEVEEMKNKGTLQETADWIDTQLITFFSLLGRFNALFTKAWDAFSLENLRDIPAVFGGLLTDFTELLQDFLTFAAEVALKVLEIIKNALLTWLSSFAADIPGFTLLTVIIRRNPFTGEVVQRTTENIIRGFMGLVPGGEAKFQELQQTGVVTKAAQRIDALIARLNITVAFIIQLFTDVWNSVSIQDLISPIETFQRIAAQFGEPISRLFSFVVEVVKIIIELILAMMNFPTELIKSIIANTLQAFNDIKRDPVEFLLNLIRAVKQGFVQFFNNIVSHLLGGLQNWLFGELGNAGVQPPPDLSFKSILGMSMDILGITVDNILERLALKIGQDKVDKIKSGLDKLTGIWTFIKDVIERGPIAIWEYIQEKISNLWTMILDGIKGWIMTTIITKVTTKLLSMLDPTGIMAVVNSAIAFFKAVQSFIEKLREMLEILNSFVAGVAEIARGSIASAANYLESALSDGIPVAISFLANQVGLGNLGEKISEMIELARGKINEGIDWLIDKAMAAGTAVLNALGLGEAEEENAETEKEEGDIDKDQLDGESKKLLDEILLMEVPFTNESEKDHKLDFEVEGTEIVLFRKSIPQDIRSHVEKVKKAIEKDENAGTKQIAGEALLKIEEAFAEMNTIVNTQIEPLFKREKTEGDQTIKVAKTGFSIEMGKKVKEYLNLIADELANIPEIDGNDNFIEGTSQERPQSSDVDFTEQSLTLSDGTISKDGLKMVAPVLSRRGPANTKGSQPNSAGYSDLYAILIENGRKIVAAHLLNHQLFGKGNSSENLTPIPGAKNTEMEGTIEAPVKEAILEENKVVRYEVSANYTKTSVRGEAVSGDDIPEDQLIPDEITAKAMLLKAKEGVSGEALKDANNWEDGTALYDNKSIHNIRGALTIKKDGATNIDHMSILMAKVDSKLAENPKLTWETFRKNHLHIFDKMQLPGVREIASTDEYKAVKQEFIEKQVSLGILNITKKPTSYEEVLIHGKRHITDLINRVSGVTNKTAEGFHAEARTKKNYVGIKKEAFTRILAKDNVGEANEVANKVSNEQNLTVANLLSGMLADLEGNLDDLKNRMIGDLKPDLVTYLIRCWEHAQSGGSPDPALITIYDRLINELQGWNDSFNTKKIEELENELQGIKSGSGGIDQFLDMDGVTTKQRQELNTRYENSDKRLKIKQGDANTLYQQILGVFQDEQDGLEDLLETKGADALERIKEQSINEYIEENMVIGFDEVDVSSQKKNTLRGLYISLRGAITSILDQKKDE